MHNVIVTVVNLLTLAFFFFNDTATTEIYTLSLHDALPICQTLGGTGTVQFGTGPANASNSSLYTNGSLTIRSEEHTSELQSRLHLVCRLLLEKNQANAAGQGLRGHPGSFTHQGTLQAQNGA